MSDKRRCHRLNVELPASFKISDAQKHVSLATILDISALGICLTSKERLVAGQELQLQVILPVNERIVLQAKVIWVKELIAYDVREYKVGIQIIDRVGTDEAKFIKFFADQFLEFFKEKPS
ncbi:MAG: PilZ domain-containing protein [Candidatus Omnitrophota bacterium]